MLHVWSWPLMCGLGDTPEHFLAHFSVWICLHPLCVPVESLLLEREPRLLSGPLPFSLLMVHSDTIINALNLHEA